MCISETENWQKILKWTLFSLFWQYHMKNIDFIDNEVSEVIIILILIFILILVFFCKLV